MSEKQINKLFAITNELQEKIKALETENRNLKNRIDQLEKRATSSAIDPAVNPFATKPSKILFPN